MERILSLAVQVAMLIIALFVVWFAWREWRESRRHTPQLGGGRPWDTTPDDPDAIDDRPEAPLFQSDDERDQRILAVLREETQRRTAQAEQMATTFVVDQDARRMITALAVRVSVLESQQTGAARPA